MADLIKFDGQEYQLDKLPNGARELAVALAEVNSKLQELHSLQAVFLRAKNSYIAELKQEIVTEKSGINLSEFFSD